MFLPTTRIATSAKVYWIISVAKVLLCKGQGHSNALMQVGQDYTLLRKLKRYTNAHLLFEDGLLSVNLARPVLPSEQPLLATCNSPFSPFVEEEDYSDLHHAFHR